MWPNIHFCLPSVLSWLRTSRTDRIWPPSQTTQDRGGEREICQNLTSTVSLSFKPSLPFGCHRNGYIIVKSQSNLFVLASQSSPLLSAAFNCLMCFPTENVEQSIGIHKPSEISITKFHISQALFSIIQTILWSQVRLSLRKRWIPFPKIQMV